MPVVEESARPYPDSAIVSEIQTLLTHEDDFAETPAKQIAAQLVSQAAEGNLRAIAILQTWLKPRQSTACQNTPPLA